MPKRVSRHAIEQPQDNSIRLIVLTRGVRAIVDAEDYPALALHNWRADRSAGCGLYAVRGIWMDGWRLQLRMHSAIMGEGAGQIIDHINGNSLDNRRSNHRWVTFSQNAINRKIQANNTSGYKGVSWNCVEEGWQVRIQIGGVQKRIPGRFQDAASASEAYQREALKIHGEYRRTA